MLFLGTGVYGQNQSEKDYQNAIESLTLTFVNQTKQLYKKGDSFETFKSNLIGEKNSNSIMKEGDELLKKAYTDIVKQRPDKEIKKDINEMAACVVLSNKLNPRHRRRLY